MDPGRQVVGHFVHYQDAHERYGEGQSMDHAKRLFQGAYTLLDRSGEGSGQKSGREEEAGEPPAFTVRGDVRGDIAVGRFRQGQIQLLW